MEKRYHVLLIESDEGLAAKIVDRLDRSRFDIEVAVDPETALSSVSSNVPTIALIDTKLDWPGDGITVAHALLEQTSIPIIFLNRGPFHAFLRSRLALVTHDAILPFDIEPEYLENAVEVAIRRCAGEPESSAESNWRSRLFEGILDLSPDAVIVLDETHRVIEWNPAAASIFGYTRAEALGQSLDDLVTSEDDPERRREAERYTSMALDQQVVPPTEAVRYRRDGTPINVVLAGTPIHVGGDFRGVVGYYHDITEQKRARSRVEELLAEKEILLREINHRVKNDFALVESILTLQASRYDSSEIKAAIEDAVLRIASVRRVYDTLHETRGARSVSTTSLIEDIVVNVRDTLDRRAIEFSLDIDEIELPTNVAIALGLVLNELLTNAVKYAFPEDDVDTHRAVSVSFRNRRNSTLLLTVADNGRGIGDRGETSKDGYGLSFVRAIASQYNGTTSINDRNGTSVTVTLIPHTLDG